MHKPSSFSEWHSRTHRWMCSGSPAVHRILESLRARSEPLTPRVEAELGAAFGLYPQCATVVSRVLADAICNTGESNVAQLSRRIGMTQGFELFRQVWARFVGIGPQVGQALRERWLTASSRRGSTSALRDRTPEMLRAFEGLKFRQQPLADVDKVLALRRSLPQRLAGQLREYEAHP